MSMSRKKFYKQERTIKGAANHRRIEIIYLLDKYGELSTNQVVGQLGINYQTGAHHVRKLARSGLVDSWRKGGSMMHVLTPHGESTIKLLKNSNSLKKRA